MCRIGYSLTFHTGLLIFLTTVVLPLSAVNAQAFRGLGFLEPEEAIPEHAGTIRVTAMSADGWIES